MIHHIQQDWVLNHSTNWFLYESYFLIYLIYLNRNELVLWWILIIIIVINYFLILNYFHSFLYLFLHYFMKSLYFSTKCLFHQLLKIIVNIELLFIYHHYLNCFVMNWFYLFDFKLIIIINFMMNYSQIHS
jgi:hypothetical protein